jgi:type IV secretion system protein VirB2
MLFAVLVTVGLASPALAGLPNVTTALSNIQSILTGAGLAVVTLALSWAGYKMLWKGAQWDEISSIVIGAVVIGGAGTLAGLIL